VSGLLSMAWDLFSFVMPIHGSRIGLSASTIGLVLGCFGSAVFVVRLVLPPIVHRLSEWKMLVGAMFITGFALTLFPFVSDVAFLMPLAFLLGMGLGGAQPMIMALLYNKAPPGRGAEAVGVRTVLLNFSQAGIPLMFGAAGAALGMAPVFWAMAAALLAGGWYARRGALEDKRPVTAKRRRPFRKTGADYLRCLLTSFVISNIETCFLPPNTSRSLSSALMLRLFLLS